MLLSSMPVKTAEHYRNKIAIYLHWYQKKGIEVPQTQQGDIGAKDVPSASNMQSFTQQRLLVPGIII